MNKYKEQIMGKNKYSVKNIWMSSFDLLVQKPVLLVPFLVVGFLEALALEAVYFAPRVPLVYVMGPIIRKLMGETFIHYPDSLLVIPNLLYYAQVLIYIVLGCFLAAVTVNLVKKIKMGIPLKTKALLSNASSRYVALFAFGILFTLVMFITKKVDTLIFYKALGPLLKFIPRKAMVALPLLLAGSIFMATIVSSTLFALTIPIIVIRKRSLLKGLFESITLGIRHFPTIFTMMLIPYFVYLPLVALKTYPIGFARRTIPEIIPITSAIGIIVAIFVECFVVVCLSQFIIHIDKRLVK
ncbi:MAG: hypothetical protein ABID09_08585 [Candidatus Omnitrophota bacterium]